MKRKYTVISQSDPSTEPPPTAAAAQDSSPIPLPEDEYDQLVPQSRDLFMRLVHFIADLIYNCLGLFFSPVSSALQATSDSYDSVEEPKESTESTIQRHPFSTSHGGVLLARKLGMGFLGAAYVAMLLIAAMMASIVVGIVFMRMFIDEPVLMKERLHFDYSDLHPKAVFSMASSSGPTGRLSIRHMFRKRHTPRIVPAGHTFQVSVLMLTPDSDYNNQIGVFQLSAELLTDKGQVMAKSSQPCMLRFRSLPVRLGRMLVLGVPLVLGISGETQNIRVDILWHREASIPRTEAIRVTLIPRAGTLSPPQLYEAVLVINSQLPWPKKLVYNWKWTVCVWVSMYTYSILLLGLLLFWRTLVRLSPSGYSSEQDNIEEHATVTEDVMQERWKGAITGDYQDRDVLELLRKLRMSRNRRKAMLMARDSADATAGSSVSSCISVSGLGGDDASESESANFG